MRPRFTNERRIKNWAKNLSKTEEGTLQIWYYERHKQGKLFEDRSYGEILEEFYLESVLEAQVLRSNLENLSAEAQRRLASLEELLEDSDRSVLGDLSPEESENEWFKAHRTGDPLIDKWEQEIARGECPNLNEDFNG